MRSILDMGMSGNVPDILSLCLGAVRKASFCCESVPAPNAKELQGHIGAAASYVSCKTFVKFARDKFIDKHVRTRCLLYKRCLSARRCFSSSATVTNAR